MAKVGYIMAISQYDKLEEDRKWMNEFGCVRIVEENDENERNRPLWKQLMVALKRGDELVIPKFSNALRGSRELATFLEFCRVKVIRIISIHDKIDSNNILFPETKPSDVLTMMGALPEEVLALRKSAEHVVDLQEKMIISLPKVSSAKMHKLDREKTVINLYVAGHPIDDIWRASGSRCEVHQQGILIGVYMFRHGGSKQQCLPDAPGWLCQHRQCSQMIARRPSCRIS